MKIAIRLAVLTVMMFTGFSSPAQSQFLTNILSGNLSSVGLAGRTNVTMTLQILTPKNRTINNVFISNDPLCQNSDTSGNFTFTNVQWGKYSFQAQDSAETIWVFYVGTNTIGNWKLASLVTNAAALPPNPATNYYTQAQINSLISGLAGGTVTNVQWSISANNPTNRPASIIFIFPTNQNYNLTNYPQGMLYTN